MSTMLKYAAMSLLSKTLQTFLYKYLLDVDVEGVAMPSFMDSDGQSGWGVRLCNVRLREGVELMTLPGKRKVKRPKPKDSSVEEKAEEPSTNGGADVSVPTDEVPKPEAQPLDVDTEDASGDVNERQILLSQDYYASDDDEGVISAGVPSTTRGSRVLSCFSRGDSTSKHVAPSPTRESKDEVDEHRKQKLATSDHTAASSTENGPEESNAQQQPDCAEDEEEFIEVEKDMVLRLGIGGRIGVLDVRLVGKELHVSVEDAFLVVEVCQKPDEPENKSDAEKAAEGAKSESTKGKESAADKKKPASKKAAEDMTVGERILENSAIARALSAVPHLFLRDCCVRLVVRDGDVTNEAKEEISEKDSVVDFGVELLSVTSGEDFLAHIRVELDDSRTSFANEAAHRSVSSFASFDESSDNEFIVKRIRTGRGPEGGIWLKVFPPGRIRNKRLSDDGSDDSDTCQWARDRWMTTSQFCLFRCSGLDVLSRIYVGKQEAESNDYWFYDEFIVDSMLVGVDYVAPGPAPLLPPLDPNADKDALDAMQAMSEANAYVTDGNGIQSVRLKSVFHKVARGLQPTVCKAGHLPCETCSECWTGNGASAETLDHQLDSSTPLAGVVFNLSLNDPLEINVDRAVLVVIGQLQSLFSKKSTSSEPEASVEEPEAEVELSSSMHGGGMCMPSQRQKSKITENVMDSFPSYMQPENIEITGLHLAKIVVRIHAMRSDGVFDGGLSFCYWEAQTRCITMDMQTLSSEKKLQDIRVDIGEFTAVEYKGTGNNQLISLGLPHPEVYSSDSNSDSNSSQSPKSSSRPPWPSTACALLGIPAPMETIHYESRERHALQMRYTDLSGSNADEDRSIVDVRVGVTSVDMPFTTKDAVYSVISESKRSVFGTPEDVKQKTNDERTNETKPKKKEEMTNDERTNETKPKKKEEVPKSSLLKCKVRVDGGRVNVYPVINLCLPPSTFFAERSSLYGLFFETMLQRIEFAHGERAKVPKSRRGCLSRLAALPEGIRLRVLLFVNDLGPLETALGLKHEPNSFLRYRGVNKAIVKVAKRSSKLKRKKSKSCITSHRREEMLAELLSLDNTALQDLWSLHQRQVGLKDVSKI